MAKKEKKGTNSYVAEINKALCKQLGLNDSCEIPVQYKVLIAKTAQDMRILDRIIVELDNAEDLTTIEIGSMGQQKTTVNPLIPYYDKMSARVTDDLYNLGLTARKQAAKGEDLGDKTKDNLGQLLDAMK